MLVNVLTQSTKSQPEGNKFNLDERYDNSFSGLTLNLARLGDFSGQKNTMEMTV